MAVYEKSPNNWLLRVIAGALTGGISTSSSPVGAPNAAITHLTANNTGTTTLASRSTRRGVSITTDGASPEAVYYGFVSGINATTGVKLAANQSQPLDYKGALFFFSTGGTGTVTLVETYD